MHTNGTSFGDATKITFPIVGTKGVSHPHQTIQYKDELFVPDLVSVKKFNLSTCQNNFNHQGGDTIWRLVPNGNRGFSIGGEIKQPTGSGPRHSAIHNDILVTLHELSNTITSQSIPPLGKNSSTFISNLSIVPEDQASLKDANFGAAEVLIPAPNTAFPDTLVYASNRNLRNNDDRGDSIAILSLDANGTLKIVGPFFT